MCPDVCDNVAKAAAQILSEHQRGNTELCWWGSLCDRRDTWKSLASKRRAGRKIHIPSLLLSAPERRGLRGTWEGGSRRSCGCRPWCEVWPNASFASCLEARGMRWERLALIQDNLKSG